MTVTNGGGSTLNGWTLRWAFPGNQQVTSSWSAVLTQVGQQVTVANAAYNGSLAPRASASFGFQAAYSGSNASPASFTLNGAACTTQ